MPTIEHHALAGTVHAHAMQRWVWPDAAARLAENVAAADVGKVGVQQDSGEFWLLRDSSGPEWAPLATARAVVNPRAFGAKGDGTDDSAPFQAALDRIAAIGGGVLDIPPGTFSLRSKIDLPSVPFAMRGAGMGLSVIDWDASTTLFSIFGGRGSFEYVELSDFTIQGEWGALQSDQPPVLPVEIYGADRVTMQRVELRNCHNFGFVLRNCEEVLITECRVRENGRDAISVATCSRVTVADNQIDHCDDDAIAVHMTHDNAGSIRQGVVIANNRISDSQGISAIGLRRASICGNQIERTRQIGISVGAAAGDETVPHAIAITGNVITDVFDRSAIDGVNNGAAYIRVQSTPQAGTGVAVPGLPDGSGAFELVDENLHNYAAGDPYPPAHWLNISGNVCARTLPSGVAYSSYGYGQMFTRNGYVDPVVTEAMLSETSIGLELAEVRDSVISNNTFRGQSAGIRFVSGSDDHDNVLIAHNIITRFGLGGIVFG
ncbi:MAG: NosD domain-containing protein, partial [Persicimonas sp.]